MPPPPPPSTDGHLGHLSSQQQALLKELWATLFDVFDGRLDQYSLAPTSASSAASFSPSAATSPNPSSSLSPAASPNDPQLAPNSPTSDPLDQSGGKSRWGLGRLKSSLSSSMSSAVSYATSGSSGSSNSEDTPPGVNASANLSPPELIFSLFRFCQHDHPDSLLLRFLRARKWDVPKAAVMALNTIRWRVGFGTEDIIAKGEEALDRGTLDSGKSYIRGVDYHGRPVVIIHARKHKQGEQTLDSLQRFTVWTMETARLLIGPPDETACLVFDLTDFTTANMDFAYIKFLIQCFQAYYPECLGTLLIMNAPWVFSSVWKLISPMLDPVVASKIAFVKNFEDLVNYIPPENIIPVFWTPSRSGKAGALSPPRPLANPANAKSVAPEKSDDDTSSSSFTSATSVGDASTPAHPQDKYEYAYVPPAANENPDPAATSEQRNAASKDRTKAERSFEYVTRAWCGRAQPCLVGSACGLSDSEIKEADEAAVQDEKSDLDEARERAVTGLKRSWWKLDPYVRARTFYHRTGVFKLEDDNAVISWY